MLDSLPSPAVHPISGTTVASRRHSAVAEIANRGLLTDTSPLCGVIDVDTLDELITALVSAYADVPGVLHTVAAKAITLRPILARFAESGFGCEVASPGELALALTAGFSPEHIVLDSPAKTTSELEYALALGISFNIDNLDELYRVDELVTETSRPLPHIGIRINPQTGAGAIGAMSTATLTSKFGIGLSDHRDELAELISGRPWITQLHAHSGSQGLALSHTARGVQLLVELADDVNRRSGRKQIRRIDVGGGLSVNFESDETTPSFADHREALQEAAPGLFDGTYEIVTEFGRALTAKAGTIVTRVEYTKRTGGRPIAVTHAGVQVATRTVFMPESWPLRLEVFQNDGQQRTTPLVDQDVAGPACFTGDMLAVAHPLPLIESGDLIALPDTGGYYFSSHFSYNALARPAVYGVATINEERRWFEIRAAQSVHEIVSEAGTPTLTTAPLPDRVAATAAS